MIFTSVSSIMRQVLLALVPGIMVMFGLFGWGVLSNLLLASLFALLLEALMLRLRQRPIAIFLQDNSALVTAWLLALSLPPYSSWWLIAIACLFAIVIAKQLYGGLGYNPFNPAMVAYAALLVSYPVEMTQWPTAFSSNIQYLDLTTTLQKVLGNTNSWDGYTAATALDSFKMGIRLGQDSQTIWQQAAFGWFASDGWEWVNLAFLLGGVWLIYRGIISWHIPVAFLLTLVLFAGVFWLFDSRYYASPLLHLFSGATLLGAFFIATDPVSASTTPLGKIIFGAGIGFLVYLIRTWGGYPDAVAFAVLIMNMAVPLLDNYTQPRVYGQS